MCHLLLDHLDRQEDAGQEVWHVQERLPPHLSVQVVPDQPPEHLSAVSESDRLLGIALGFGALRLDRLSSCTFKREAASGSSLHVEAI